MSELSPEDLAQRLDDLLKEVRRQGRAAIAAQAAAESCLEAVREQAGAASGDDDEAAGERVAEAVGEERVRWLRALIPVCDALDRVIRQAAALDAPGRRERSWLRRLLPEHDDGRAQAALVEGLRVLGAQLEGTLGDLGASVDRQTGEIVDGERHRVVEVRPPGPGHRRGTVIEVVRPGYTLDQRVIREAEVVAADVPRKA